VRADQELWGDRVPTYLTRFLGRTGELAELDALLRSQRLVTVRGPGGVGKSRLAAEGTRRLSRSASGSFPDSVCWVPVGAVADPEDLLRTIARALGLPVDAPADALGRAVSSRRGLLVLDHGDRLTRGCADILDALLVDGPELSMLVTSRLSLGLESERVVDLAALTSRDGDTGDGAAVALLVERGSARAANRHVPPSEVEILRHLCERLDGLPLAIEIAAGWCRVRAPGTVLAELDAAIRALASDDTAVGDCSLSTRALLDLSWQWLGADERRVYLALGVFTGGFTHVAAESVAGVGLPSLASLADRALIQRLPDPTGGTRYEVHPLVRDHALMRLESSSETRDAMIRARHVDYFLSLVETARASLELGAGQGLRDVLDTDAANLESALDWAIDTHQVERALPLATQLFSEPTCYSPSPRTIRVLARTLGLPWDASSESMTRARARALRVAGRCAADGFEITTAREWFGEALTLDEHVGDARCAASSLRGLGTVQLLSTAPGSVSYQERSLTICRSIGDEPGIAWSTYGLAEGAFVDGDLDRALARLAEASTRFERLGIASGQARCHLLLGDARRQRAEWEQALVHFARALTLQEQTRDVALGGGLLDGVAGVAAALRSATTAAMLLGAGDSWRELHGLHRIPTNQPVHDRDVARARRQLGPDAFAAAYRAGRGLMPEDMLTALRRAGADLVSGLDERPAGLTYRELEVLDLVADGLSNGEIALRLVVSPRTVHAHLRSIFGKLGVTTRTAAAHQAGRLSRT
jgi:predicted ATPase/DNA-binding CsgD family transcriptional regulator